MSDSLPVRQSPEHYMGSQGLGLVPLGVVFVGVGLWHDGQLAWLPGAAHGRIQLWLLGALGIAVLASQAISAYYRRLGRMPAFHAYHGSAGQMVVTAILIVASLLLQDAFRWPISLPLVVIGAVLAYLGIASQPVRGHYIGIAVSCLIMANIASFGVPVRTQQVMLDLLIAGGLFTAGIGDHLLLLRLLDRQITSPPAEVHGLRA
jgi:hypothetical protein